MEKDGHSEVLIFSKLASFYKEMGSHVLKASVVLC